jgi:phosphoserine / homoserine phosphotransferase
MHLVCLDLEGVLVPEIWIAVAEKTGHPELRRTTRDEPDYDKLMRYRLDLLDRHRITLPAIQEVISTLRPLPGAVEFLAWLRERTQVLILSDTFEQFGRPLMRQLGWPTLLCHELETDSAGRITGYRLRQPDQKRRAVKALRSLNYDIIAAGDSHNDLAMLQAAHHGILFCPTDAFAAANPNFPVARDHTALRAEIEKFLH